MEQRQVEGIDAYNFPVDLVRNPQLMWMGDDYVRFVAVELLRRFRQQDNGTDMLAIRCEAPPKLLTRVDESTGTLKGALAEFDLQILLQASDGRHWRLRGDGKFSADGLDEPGQTTVSVGFSIRSNEQVQA
jgi:hypothetical protein